MCGDEDRPKWGKLTLVLEGLEGTGLLGLLSGGEGSGRAEDSSEAGSSLHLGKEFDTTELGREAEAARLRQKIACNLHPSPRSLLQFGEN